MDQKPNELVFIISSLKQDFKNTFFIAFLAVYVLVFFMTFSMQALEGRPMSAQHVIAIAALAYLTWQPFATMWAIHKHIDAIKREVKRGDK